MIRCFLAACTIIYSLVNMVTGGHPAWAILSGVIGMVLVAWYCVSKFEDQPQLQ